MSEESSTEAITRESLPSRFGFQPEKVTRLENHIRILTGRESYELPIPERQTIEHYEDAIVAVAKAVVDIRNKEKGVIPSSNEYSYMSPEIAAKYHDGARTAVGIADFLGRFELTEGLSDSIRDRIEGKANERVLKEAHKINEMLNVLESTPRPRQQLLEEIAHFYEDSNRGGKISKNVSNFLDQFYLARSDGDLSENFRQRYPLSASFISVFRPSAGGLGYQLDHEGKDKNLDIVQPEIMQSMHEFLGRHEVDVDEPAIKTPHQLRGFAELFKKYELEEGFKLIREKTGKILDDTLEAASDLIPEDGPSFALAVRKQFEMMAEMKRQGLSPEEIIQKVESGEGVPVQVENRGETEEMVRARVQRATDEVEKTRKNLGENPDSSEARREYTTALLDYNLILDRILPVDEAPDDFVGNLYQESDELVYNLEEKLKLAGPYQGKNALLDKYGQLINYRRKLMLNLMNNNGAEDSEPEEVGKIKEFIQDLL